MRYLWGKCAIAIAQENIDGVTADIGHSEVEMVISVEMIDDGVLGTRVVSNGLLSGSDEYALACDI